jgi:hypothetical protein
VGQFDIETVVDRRAEFMADERRRNIVGANPQGVPAALLGEAYMLGQLFMRIVKAPKWWTDSDGGLLLKDENIIGELYRMMELKVKERETGVVDEGKDAIKKLEKSAKKIVRAEEGADAQE